MVWGAEALAVVGGLGSRVAYLLRARCVSDKQGVPRTVGT